MQGLGCRSGGLLLYAVTATIVWLLLVAAALFSHWAMLIYQREHNKCANPSAFQSRLGYHQRSFFHSFVCVLATVTRLSGKALAIGNTIWIITTEIFEYAGVYNTCWCLTRSLGKGSKGWVTLFRPVQELIKVALPGWVAGIAMSVVVCVVAVGFFLFSCSDDGVE